MTQGTRDEGGCRECGWPSGHKDGCKREARTIRGWLKGTPCLYTDADECPDIDCSHNNPDVA